MKQFTLAPQLGQEPTAGLANVKVEKRGRVGIVTFNRPRSLNALCDALIADLGTALRQFEADMDVGCIIITGAGRAFAAGADIKEMKDKDFFLAHTFDHILPWQVVSECKVPIVAAVNGFALGGGCEIAMMCDIVIASEKAVFGQPEIKLGTIPGAGGTQRLIRAVGKSKAMEMVLTGRMMKAKEAEAAGLVSRVVPPVDLMTEALKVAETIASMSLPVVKLCKKSVNAANNLGLDMGIQVERQLFHSTFALDDRKEGMSAFVDKRAPIGGTSEAAAGEPQDQ
eukprot:CAMPEP_0205828414 /NCGR_PEP_ID=MMETSP0206-20130828/35041_1 /ASSEMBLY_ACC=CAM_ASM_000279 /TAXON_ID=36767 /ORGANISM="Euplotes focardii, Strain TN1" /LENGTH=282 /DNA_ID=CAMNT_0053130211 /DNA_START=51 /DNA_END=897 /DNA_ORIENTATION=+